MDSAPGRGSRFSITVPRATCAESPHTSAATRPAIPSRALAGTRIVVVDDDPAVVDAMRALFASWTAIAAGGDAAASALAALAADDRTSRSGVDLIIADLRLGNGASGIEAIAELRSRLGMETPALIVSGDTSAAARAEVESAGIRLLLKPVVAATLREAAAAALASRARCSTL